MDTVTNIDTLNDSAPMPELSFEDLLDDSPVKKAMGFGNDPLGLEEEFITIKNETLNTPGPKKPPQQHNKQHAATTLKATTTTQQHMKPKSIIEHNATTKAPTTTTIIAKSTTATNTLNANKSETTGSVSSAPILLNSKNILPKSVSSSGGSQLVRISQKVIVTGASTLTRNPPTSTISMTGATATTTVGGKTAIKTANGQILYIQKKATNAAACASGGGVPPTASGSRLTSSTDNSSGAATTTATSINKTVAFKLMRTPTGTLVPLKSPNTTASTTTAGLAVTTVSTDLTAKKTLTLSPKVTCKLSSAVGNKRLISTAGGGQIVLPTSVTSTATTCTANTTATNKSATTTTSATVMSNNAYRSISSSGITSGCNNTINAVSKGSVAGGHKILVQTANGKQIMVSNQQLIKLSPKPTTPAVATGNSTALSSTSATVSKSSVSGNTITNNNSSNSRQLQAIQLPGKSVQYLRVVSKGTVSSADTTGAGNVTNASKSTIATSTSMSNPSASLAGSTQSGTTTIKIVSAAAGGVPPKFTVVRPSSTGSPKIILTQSPKKEGTGSSVPVTFSPVTSKVQKTIVTVPQTRTSNDGQHGHHNVSNTTTTTTANRTSTFNTQLINNTSSLQSTLIKHYAGSPNPPPLIRKHKISEINSELKRITNTVDAIEAGGATTSSTAAPDDTGVVRICGAPPEAKKLAAGGRFVMLPRSMLCTTTGAGQMRKVTVQSNAGGLISQNGPQAPTSKLTVQQQQQQQQPINSVLKSNNNLVSAELVNQKSLLLSGKTQALVTQQQQQHQQLQQQQQQQQQQNKMMQLKRQIQQDQQQQQQQLQQQSEKCDINKLNTLTRDTTGSSNNNNNNINSNNNNNYNNSINSNSDSAADSNLLNFKIKLEPIDDTKPDIKPLAELLPDVANGGIRRKHCNCSKSQCLKLYCDCFANGEFCQDCTCKDCSNNLQNEDQRQRAIKYCLERNPSAFKPKITTSCDQGDMRHNKGCNCKRSGCLKNYCECYEAKIPCSSNCKCIGCRNIEERPDLDMDPIDPKLLATLAAGASLSGNITSGGQKRTYDKINYNNKTFGFGNEKLFKDTAKALAIGNDLLAGLAGGSGSLAGSSCSTGGVGGGGNGVTVGGANTSQAEKPQCNFITQEVVDATIQCMISQADECEKNGLPAYQTEKMVMEEMGRCLVEIIDFSIRNTDSSFTQD